MSPLEEKLRRAFARARSVAYNERIRHALIDVETKAITLGLTEVEMEHWMTRLNELADAAEQGG